jgi:exopolysaccharide biosynthesis polyprenyl glycosylphosphotransferase
VKTAHSVRKLWPAQFLCDIAAVITAYLATFYIRFHSPLGGQFFDLVNRVMSIPRRGDIGPGLELFYIESAPRIIAILVVTLTFLYACADLYSERRFLRRRPVAWYILLANLAALLSFYGYWYITRNTHHPRSMFFTLLVLNVVFSIGFRACLGAALQRAYRKGHYAWRTLILGSGSRADQIRNLVAHDLPHGIRIVSELDADPSETEDAFVERLVHTIGETDASLLIVCDPDLTIPRIMRIIESTELLGVTVKVASERMGVITYEAGMPTDTLQGVPIVNFPPARLGSLYARLKELVSYVVAIGVLVLLSPLWILIALAVRLTSHGPSMFIQERIGFNRETFAMYKYRTMRRDADQVQAELEVFNESGEGLFKMRRDPRVTGFGRFLRRFSLDEIPQMINILKGDMTLVGPRPLPRRDFENYYEEWHYGRHGGKPGLTCVWQVSGRSEIDFRNMCLLDIYYLRNQSWVLDIKILLRTVYVVLFARGAY